jgi:hypothetical protein
MIALFISTIVVAVSLAIFLCSAYTVPLSLFGLPYMVILGIYGTLGLGGYL